MVPQTTIETQTQMETQYIQVEYIKNIQDLCDWR